MAGGNPRAYPWLVAGSRIAPAPPDGSPRGELPAVTGGEPAGAEHDGAFLRRPEVRDVLAWMRLLVDPTDAAAVVRALARPPIELRQVELARVIQVARRRKLDLVLGLAAAVESPQVPPEARERIQRFVELHRSATAELATDEPDVFVGKLIERLGARTRSLMAPEDQVEQRAGLERLHHLAVEFVRSAPLAGTRDLARYLASVDRDLRSYADLADQEPDLELDATLQLLREEVLDGVARIGGRLGELRLDTDLDISHGVVRYLELLKVSALLQRPEAQGLDDALADVNARLLAAVTPLQREIFQTSTLDQTIGACADRGGTPTEAGDPVDGNPVDAVERARGRGIAPREQHSLGPFLPRKGVGLALSASDIHTYRSCPLRYKYARVLRIPTEQTVHQRFGIVVHQVLERYHSEGAQTLSQMLGLLDTGWRRAGFREGERDRELLEKARVALTRYHARLESEDSQPVWFERQFDFRLGPHHLRGRVDRVDRLATGADAEYELIDYKTSRPKSAEQLRDDIQLSLYALAAREDWQLESTRQAYYYVLDDLKVPVARGDRDAESVRNIVLEVGEGILAQEFEPTPSRAACSTCDYRIVCPVAEG
jgi:CRISPR/Cas system-associated exonuclease Cas4 (RecB family)